MLRVLRVPAVLCVLRVLRVPPVLPVLSMLRMRSGCGGGGLCLAARPNRRLG